MASHTPVVIVDDADPAIIYEPANLWEHQAHQENVHGATWSGGYTNATAKFSINGTSYTLWGAVIPPKTDKLIRPPDGQVILDGVPQTPFVAATGDGNEDYYAYNYWGPANGSAGEHTIEIHVLYGDQEDHWPFILDYIEYVPLPATAATPSATSFTPSVAATPSATPPPSEATSGRGRPFVGPIVGSVLGAVAGLGICLVLALWWRRQKREKPHPILPAWSKDVLDQESQSSAAMTVSSASGPAINKRIQAASGTRSEPIADPLAPVPISPPPQGERTALLCPVSPVSASPRTPGLLVVANASGPGSPSNEGVRPLPDPVMPPPVPTFAPPAPATSPPSDSKSSARPAERRPLPPAPERPTTVFHSDSGIRFVPPPVAQAPLPDDSASVVLSEVPPEYTER
ncbi:hypothetical protein PYCCODRAFT_1476046 [Trametes coccinea BRFM310]|uniref:Uncharacterized protein n=1 Tax=Trametes coccinea (strain BRFM310) TaxID=1353009 RepID=A0A1Y2ITM8_TRAC3|nr:hypothetical protein PYCCODRAFT_1476046 [Trametes coccinea BRFM310]